MRVLIALLLIAAASAFSKYAANRPARMTMLFGGAKKAPEPKFEVNKGSANKGTYIPDGLTAAQYAAVQKEEEKKKADKLKKFPRGKVTESLTEWFEKVEKKGLVGKDARLGHRYDKENYIIDIIADLWKSDFIHLFDSTRVDFLLFSCAELSS